MDPARYARIAKLFAEVVDLSDEERRVRLDAACGDDADLRARVDAMVRRERRGPEASHPLAEAQVRSVRERLERVVASAGAPPADAEATLDGAVPAGVPSTIGRYRIVRRIAVGGMGVVYEAMQDAPRRRVALKIVPAHRATPDRLRRFRQEAEILGHLQHPGIAQVHEAGMFDLGEGAQPFFAMEYVDGVDIRTYADRAALDLRQRLSLVAGVADAVQYAHDKGVIHRDLKPDNVIVDASGRPKILDFGVARAAESSAAISTVVTHAGQIIGTLAYMAPEQLSADPDRVTPRADVYALGVMLYELLTDRLPHDVAGLPTTAAIRALTEADAPRLGRTRPGLRGDVETIVGMALEKDPDRRYGSAAAFAADLRRHLAHEPIEARPASTVYRARKFVRRHPTLVGGASATLLVLVAGLVVAVLLAGRERDQRRRADLATSEARESAARVVSVLMAGVTRSMRQGQVWPALDQLDAIPAGSRDWGWRLMRLALPRELDLRHEYEALTDVPGEDWPQWQFLDDDHLVAADPELGDVAIVDLPGATVERRLFAGLGLVGSTAPTAAGRMVAWSAHEAFVLDLAEERILDRWPVDAPIVAGSLSDDGRVVGLGHGDGSWVVRVGADAPRRFASEGVSWRPWSGIRIAPDGRALFVNRLAWLEIVDVETGTRSRIDPRPPFDRILAHPVETGWVAHQWRDGSITDSRTELVAGTHPELGTAIQPRSDSGLMESTTRDGALAGLNGPGCFHLRRTDGAALEKVSRFQGAHGRLEAGGRYVNVPTVSPTGRRALVFSAERKPWLVDLAEPGGATDDPRCGTYREHDDFVYHLAVSHDGSMIASASPREPRIRVWDARTLETIVLLERATAEYGSRDALLAFTPDDEALVATTPIDGADRIAVVRWNLREGTRATWTTDVPRATGNHLAALGPFVAALGPSGRGRLSQRAALVDGAATAIERDYVADFGWPAPPVDRSGEGWRTLPQPGAAPRFDVTGLAVHPTADLVATVGVFTASPGAPSENGRLVLRSLPGGDIVRETELQGQPWCADWSPDGSLIAVGTNRGRVLLIETTFLTTTLELDAHDLYVYSIAWLPDGHRLVTASGDRTLRVWDDRTPEQREAATTAWLALRARAAQDAGLRARYDALDGDARAAARIELIRRAPAPAAE